MVSAPVYVASLPVSISTPLASPAPFATPRSAPSPLPSASTGTETETEMAREVGSSHRRRQEREALRTLFNIREAETAAARRLSRPTALRPTTTTRSATSHERTETFAPRLADELPALQYICVEIERDAPQVPPSRTSSGRSQQQTPAPARSPASICPVADAAERVSDVGAVATAQADRAEREGEDGRWLCLDPPHEVKGCKILDADGLSLEDVVRL
ncbi:hypothetical protein OH77DRAFT_1568981 [Trametes cingulata]|nr:hypothetical protein OH77DRAFT_1568981 [Trametes cingulata]